MKIKQKQKNNNIVFFSYTKKTIYLYLFTYSAGGQDGVLLETCIQCCDCTDKRSHGHINRKLASFQLNSFSCVSCRYFSIFKRWSRHLYKEQLSSEKDEPLWISLGVKQDLCSWSYALHATKHAETNSQECSTCLACARALKHQQIHLIRLHQPLCCAKKRNSEE